MLSVPVFSEPLSLNRRDRIGWWTFVTITAVLLGALAYQASDGRIFTPTAEGYYEFATDALTSGQLQLKVVPRPELMQLSDPYNSALNQPYREIDLSLYRGRYYFYWGLTPVVLFFLPCYLLTGHFASEALACAFFATVALASGGWLLLAMRRHHFAGVAGWLTLLALGAFTLASFLPLAAAGNSVYGVPIAAAACFQTVAWCCVACGLHSKRIPVGWAAGAGLALGLTLGARPNYALWAPVFFVPLIVIWMRHTANRVWFALAAVLPPVLAVGVMLLLNRMRFGHWTEFGMHYQLTGPAQPEVLFSWRNIIPNFGVYGWNPPVLIRWFPFVTTPAAGPFGVFSALPIVFGVAGCVSLRSAATARLLIGSMGLAGLGGLLATCAFFGCGGRYQIDYLPVFTLAGAMGLLAWAAPVQRTGRRWAPVLAAAVLLTTGLVGALLQIQAWGSSGDRLRPLAVIFNRPVFWFDDWMRRPYGPIRLRVELPRGRTGAFEPLLTTGDALHGGEMFFLHYADATHVRVGFFQTGTTHWLSAPLALDFSKPQEFEIRLGSLNPPDSHPVFASVADAARKAAQQEVAVIWAGRTVYRATLDFGGRHGGGFAIGENRVAAGASGPRFTGRVLRVEQVAFQTDGQPPPAFAEARGPWRLRVRFPRAGVPSRYDPLLVSGITGAANFVYVFYPAPGKIAFGHDAWGYGGSTSQTIAVDLEREHVVEIDHGGLYPAGADASVAAERGLHNRLRVTLDGVIVLDAGDRTFAAPADTITVGENRLGGSSTAAQFSGELLSAEIVGRDRLP